MSAKPADSPLADTATVIITGLDHEGQGVARVDGKVVFVPGALPGETVRFRYGRRRKKFDSALLVEVLTPSPDRATPPCPAFGVCGGCSVQHLRAEAQVAAKQQVLQDTLQHVGKVQPESWAAPLSGPGWGYRRKARLGARVVPKKGGMIVGFRERANSFITPLSDCKILDPRFASRLPALRELLAGLSCPDRLPQIEVAAGDDQAALVFRHLDPLTDGDRARLTAFGQETGLQIYLQPKGPDSIHFLWPAVPAPLTYRLPDFDVQITFRPTDFVQVNAAVNRLMVAQAIDWLDPQPTDRVLDLFCGLGNFTLPLARRAGEVLGMEADEVLVAAAGGNAEGNRITNARFKAADLYRETGTPPWHGYHFNKLLLDPPRSGALEPLKHLPADGPARIVYVSCNPATLARDADYLVHERGYRLRRAGAMDMFPQTSHVESMAWFEKS